MIEQPTRRGVLQGLLWIAAAPAIVRASSIMPIKALPQITLEDFAELQKFVITDITDERGLVFDPPFNVYRLEGNIAGMRQFFGLGMKDLKIGDTFTIEGITEKS